MNRLPFSEAYVSVDVETAGPNPAQYSLLSIGACLVADPRRTFCVELQPVNGNATAEALTVTGLSLKELAGRGLPPAEAMARFEEWLKAEISSPQRLVFVAFNAPFDWMFVNDYFHRFLGRNPFGHAALESPSTWPWWASVGQRPQCNTLLPATWMTAGSPTTPCAMLKTRLNCFKRCWRNSLLLVYSPDELK